MRNPVGAARLILRVLLVLCLVPSMIHVQSAGAAEGATRARWSGNVNLFLGAKFLDGGDWEPVDRQAQGGILIDCRHRVVPVSLALDFLYSRDEDDVDMTVLGIGKVKTKVEGETAELNLGLRTIWAKPKRFRPFVGGGLAVIHAQVEASTGSESVSDDATAVGVWLDAGAYLTLSGRWNIGVDGRWSWAKADMLGVDDGDVGGWHLGALTGVHW